MISKAIRKYLQQYAEPEAASATPPNDCSFAHCLTIPVYAETPDFLNRLIICWPSYAKLLVILVVNRPEVCDKIALARAQDSLDTIRQILPVVTAENSLLSWRKTHSSKISFLLVDRCTHRPIPNKQGVGLARKIGCDIALGLFAEKHLITDWIHTTDADAHLPVDYFDQKFPEASAAVYPCRYREAAPDIFFATQIYDQRNRDYQNRLRAAGSPYAYNPTGSLLALHLPSYAQVRGFPKRAGGEDFYLLNKLQKINGVAQLDSRPVELESRVSDRVPFGTGPAVAKLLHTKTPDEEPLFYHPDCFNIFELGLASMRNSSPSDWLRSKIMPTEFKMALGNLNLHEAQKHLQPLFDSSTNDVQTSRSYQQHLDLWFDAFQTLKTIHYLRDHFFGCITYNQWLERNENQVK